jgi:glycosyltransferase involved in cell wall biosynthesis
LVPVDRADALAAAVQELRTDAALRQRLSEAGPARARHKYHESAVVAQLAALYQDLGRVAERKGALIT